MNKEIGTMSTISRSVEYGLRLIGVWPGTPCAILIQILTISSMVVVQTFQYQYVIVRFNEEDLMILMDALSVTFAYSLLFIKMIFFTFNSRLLNGVIACVIEDWRERDISNEYMMTRIAYTCRRISNLIISMHVLSVVVYAAATVLKIKNSNETDDQELIMRMEIPFKMENKLVHATVLLTQFIHQSCVAGMVGVINCFLIILVFHLCGQIDIMRRKLNEIVRKNVEEGVTESIVKKLIVRHQRIISFSKDIEALYSNIALIQFVSNTVVICCIGFRIVISIGAPGESITVVKSVFFYIVMSLEAFIYCFAGEYLSTKSEMIGDAAYESLWYELNPNQNRDIFIMIMRSQKQLTLTIGKVAELSLKQFTNVVKASASYVSVLHAMY